MPRREISRPQEALLMALSVFHYYTAEKLAEYLSYSPGSLRDVKRHLQQLEKGKFVEVANKQIRASDTPYVYTLGRNGRAYLKEAGIAVDTQIGRAHV